MILKEVYDKRTNLLLVAMRPNGKYISLAYKTYQNMLDRGILSQEDIAANDWEEKELV